MKLQIVLVMVLVLIIVPMSMAATVGYWEFNEGTAGNPASTSAGALLDSGAMGNHATAYGPPYYVAGDPAYGDGIALDYDGGNDYALVANDGDFDMDSFTIEALINIPSTVANTGKICAAYQVGHDEFWIRSEFDGSLIGEAKAVVDDGTVSIVTGSTVLVDSQWHHVALVRDVGAAEVRLYVDYSLEDTATSAGTSTLNIADYVGLACDSYNPTNGELEGKIDFIRISNTALDPCDFLLQPPAPVIKLASNPSPTGAGVDLNADLSWSSGDGAISHDVYFGTNQGAVTDANTTATMGVYKIRQSPNTYDPCTMDISQSYYWRIDEVNGTNIWKGDVWSFTTMGPPQIVGYWEFNEKPPGSWVSTDPNAIIDSSGSGNHATAYGVLDYVDGNSSYGDGIALRNDGDSNYVLVANNGDFNFGSFTIEGMIKIDASVTDTKCAVAASYFTGHNEFWLRSDTGEGSGEMIGFVYDGTGQKVTGTTNVRDGQWHHVALVRDINAAELRLYVDYALEDTNTAITTNILDIADYVGLGNDYFNEGMKMDGDIDFIRISNWPLDPCDFLSEASPAIAFKLASNPSPTGGGVEVSADLSWSAGEDVNDVNGHHVYFGTDQQDVTDANTTVTLGVYKGSQSSTTYDPCTMDFSQSYYWRIDEVNGSDIWKGNIWSFTCIDSNIAEDMFILARDWLETDSSYLLGWSAPLTGFDDPNTHWVNDGTRGACLEFDGVDDKLDIPDEAMADFHSRSFSMWIKPTTASDCYITKATHDDTGGANPEKGRVNIEYFSGNIYAVVGNGGSPPAETFISNSTAITTGVWHHIALVMENMVIASQQRCKPKFYVDGSEVGLAVGTSPYLTPRTGPLSGFYIGGYGIYNWDGRTDDFRVYDYELTQGDIDLLVADSNLAVGPAVEYKLDETTCYMADDLSDSFETYVPLESAANVYDDEPAGSKIVNFKDYALLAESWLDVLTLDTNSESNIASLRKAKAHLDRGLILHSDGQPMDIEDQQKLSLTFCDEFASGVSHFQYTPGTKVNACTYSLMHRFNVSTFYRSEVAKNWPVGGISVLYGEEGSDGLDKFIDFCKQNGYEAFWAMRTNDTHDVTPDGWISSLWKQEHTDLLVGTESSNPPYAAWTALNYAEPLVREEFFKIAEEICQNYEIDGLMFDFFRHLPHFMSTAWGGIASNEEREMMNSLFRDIREMADEIGAERGRPILLIVRTPDSPDYSSALGLDVEQWMAEDLIDIWVATGYFRLQDWEDTVAIAKQYDVPVWASLDESRVTSSYNSKECYRARVMNAWNAGVDSIYLFNFSYSPGTPQFNLLNEIGNSRQLAYLDKTYVPDPRGAYWTANYLNGGESFFTRPLGPSPSNPYTLPYDIATEIILGVGDDVYGALRDDISVTAELELDVNGLDLSSELEVKFNNTIVTATLPTARPLEYVILPTLINNGNNSILITPSKETGPYPTILLEDVSLRIVYP